MNLPNKLTLTRILLVPMFMIFVSLTSLSGIQDNTFQPVYYLIAGIIFAVASFTDFLDGHLARKWNMVTDFGKFGRYRHKHMDMVWHRVCFYYLYMLVIA